MMLLQLDPGFTGESFAAHVAVEAIAAVIATLGALAIAWLVFYKSRESDREIFRQTIQANIDLQNDEAAERKRSQEAEALARFHQSIRRIAREVTFDKRLAKQISHGAGLIPLRSDALQEIFGLDRALPDRLDLYLHRTLYAIERYNWQAEHGSHWDRALRDALEGCKETEQALAEFCAAEGIEWTPMKPIPEEEDEAP